MPNYAQQIVDAMRDSNTMAIVDATKKLQDQYNMSFNISETNLLGAESLQDILCYELLLNTNLSTEDCTNALALDDSHWEIDSNNVNCGYFADLMTSIGL